MFGKVKKEFEQLMQERNELAKKVVNQKCQIDLLTNCNQTAKTLNLLRNQNIQLEKDGCELITALQFVQKEVRNLEYTLSLVTNEINHVMEVKPFDKHDFS